MNFAKWLLRAAIFAGILIGSLDQVRANSHHHVTGNFFLSLGSAEQMAYMIGYMDGAQSDCFAGLPAGQVTAMVLKAMKEVPQLWGENMASLLYFFCEAPESKPATRID